MTTDCTDKTDFFAYAHDWHLWLALAWWAMRINPENLWSIKKRNGCIWCIWKEKLASLGKQIGTKISIISIISIKKGHVHHHLIKEIIREGMPKFNWNYWNNWNLPNRINKVATPIQFPSKSLASPIFAYSKERTWNGFITVLQRTYYYGINRQQGFSLKKKNFRTTLQLVTRCVVMLYLSKSCSGDSF